MSKRKIMAFIATASLLALIVTGTFAWSSLNSQKVNEWFGKGHTGTGPGGTLHDDHNDNEENKDVYIENWGGENLFVRIRLTEYMEVGEGAGLKSVYTDPSTAEIIHNPMNISTAVNGGDIDHLNTWKSVWQRFHEEGDPLLPMWVTIPMYWKWNIGGQKYYYPAPVGSREDKNYIDQNSPDNLTANSINENGVQAKQTRPAEIMTMATWKLCGSPVGDYWVIDKDPLETHTIWIYWAAPLKPGDATGLLLNAVTLKPLTPDDEKLYGRIFDLTKGYYYGINVEAQMATKDSTTDTNVLMDNYTRFGDADQGGWSIDGQRLMEILVGNETPDPPNAYIAVDKATMIGNTIYAKPKQAFTLTGTGKVNDTINYEVEDLNINGALSYYVTGNIDNIFYTINIQNNKLQYIMALKDAAPIGFKIPINGRMNVKFINFNEANAIDLILYDNSKTIVAIPDDCCGVVKGNDGYIYLTYSNGIYRKFTTYDSGEVSVGFRDLSMVLGPEINILP